MEPGKEWIIRICNQIYRVINWQFYHQRSGTDWYTGRALWAKEVSNSFRTIQPSKSISCNWFFSPVKILYTPHQKLGTSKLSQWKTTCQTKTTSLSQMRQMQNRRRRRLLGQFSKWTQICHLKGGVGTVGIQPCFFQCRSKVSALLCSNSETYHAP